MDTNYYHWVGLPGEIDRSKNNSNCWYARWEMKPDVPDGLYYIYSNVSLYAWQDTARGIDTTCYEVVMCRDGLRDGHSTTYDIQNQKVLFERDYDYGRLIQEVRYEYEYHSFPCSRRDPTTSHGSSFSIGLVGGDFITFHDRFDALGRCTFSNATIPYGYDTLTCFEEWARYDTLEVYVINYHYGPEHKPASEIIVRDSVLTMKRWCEDGELYYHQEQKIVPREDGTWYTKEVRIIVNLLESEQLEWGEWWRYNCKD